MRKREQFYFVQTIKLRTAYKVILIPTSLT